MKTIDHLIKTTAHFICENCGDTAQIIIPAKGKNKISYCCTARYEAYWNDTGESVVKRIKDRKEYKVKRDRY